MVGYFRFVLAALVLWSHLNYPLWSIAGVSINQGSFAVFCFYLVSGFFTAVIFDRFNGKYAIAGFYQDRMMRIMPAFLAVMTTVILINIVHYESSLGASAADYYDPYYWQLAVLQPLNGLMAFFNNGDYPYGPFFAFTPVASLALEVQYFIIFPILALLPRSVIVVITVLTVAWVAQVTATESSTALEAYTYRHLIGVLPIFLIGFLTYSQTKAPRNTWSRGEVIGVASGCLLFAVILIYTPASTQWVGEMALSVAITPVILNFALRFKSGEMDKLAGYLSYGVFLAHIPVIRFLHYKGAFYSEFFIALGIATLAAYAVHVAVEKPVLRLRHRIARPRDTALPGAPRIAQGW